MRQAFDRLRHLASRSDNMAPAVLAVRAIGRRAQLRLCGRYRRLTARGLHKNRVCVAIARELCGFIWDLARQVPMPH